MKHFLSTLLVVFLFTACQNNCEERYTQESSEIETTKQIGENYLSQDWEAYKSHYTEDAKIYYNATDENPASIDQIIEGHKPVFENFSDVSFLSDKDYYEMVVTNEGETWVNYWGVWQGTLKATGQVIQMPIHLTSQFVDGKVVKEHGYWDLTNITLALMALENNSVSDEED